MFFKRKKDLMFQERLELRNKILDLEKERKKLREEVEDLKLKRKIEDEDIKHLVKLSKEKQAIELQKKEMVLEKEKNEVIAKVKDDYRNKLEGFLNQQKNDIKDMYGEILKRLPDINVRLKGDVSK